LVRHEILDCESPGKEHQGRVTVPKYRLVTDVLPKLPVHPRVELFEIVTWRTARWTPRKPKYWHGDR